ERDPRGRTVDGSRACAVRGPDSRFGAGRSGGGARRSTHSHSGVSPMTDAEGATFPWREGPISQRFAGRVALVTGAGGAGIGSASACRLASEGAAIVAVESHDGRAKAIVETIESTYDVPVLGFTA